MPMPTLLDYQRQLIIASLDDFTPNGTLTSFHGGQYGENAQAWRAAVTDFLCVALDSGLIEATHRKDISDKRDVGLLRYLLEQGESDRDISRDILWDVMYFNGTPLLVDIMLQCGLHSWDSLSAPESQDLALALHKACGGFGWRFTQELG